MTIPVNQRENPSRYMKHNGFVNLGFITGAYVANVPLQAPIKNVIWIQPPGIKNLHHALPIYLDPSKAVHLPPGTSEGDHIHVRVRLEHGILSEEEYWSVIPRAIIIDRPNIINSNVGDQIKKIANEAAIEQASSAMPMSEDRIIGLNPAASQIRHSMSAYVAHKALGVTASGALCMSMLLRIGPDENKAIHARMYARTDKAKSILRLYYQHLYFMKPYFFTGSYRVNPKAANEEGEDPRIVKFGYFHVDVIAEARPNDLPGTAPDWVAEALQKHKQALETAQAGPRHTQEQVTT